MVTHSKEAEYLLCLPCAMGHTYSKLKAKVSNSEKQGASILTARQTGLMRAQKPKDIIKRLCGELFLLTVPTPIIVCSVISFPGRAQVAKSLQKLLHT